MSNDGGIGEVLKRNETRLEGAIESFVESWRRYLPASVDSSASVLEQTTSLNHENSQLKSDMNRSAKGLATALWNYRNGVDTDSNTWRKPEVSKSLLDDLLMDRAQDLLHAWRQTLTVGSVISCPDWVDEFEFANESSGLIKLYEAQVVRVATNREARSILLGEATQQRQVHVLQPNEKAILVGYEGYSEQEHQWVLLERGNTLAEHVIPFESHHEARRALEAMPLAGERPNSGYSVSDGPVNPPAHLSLVHGTSEQLLLPRKVTPTPADTPPTSAVVAPTEERSTGSEMEITSFSSLVLEQNGVVLDNQARETAVSSSGAGVEMNPERKLERAPSEERVLNDATSRRDESRQTRRNRKGRGRVLDEPKKQSLPNKKRSWKSAENNNDFVWICAECKEAEAIADPDSLLIICEGPCQRPFHVCCTDLRAPPTENEAWACTDCSRKHHRCGFCQEYGEDDVDVFHCQHPKCGLFFHLSCLQMHNVELQFTSSQVATTQGSEGVEDLDGFDNTSTPTFTCPAHQCWSCTEEFSVDPESTALEISTKSQKTKGKKKKTRKGKGAFGKKNEMIYRCLECPIAYHPSCIPPTCRFHELAILCHEHSSSCKLPELDFSTSLQAGFEKAADKRLESKLKTGGNANKKRKREADNCITNTFFLGLRGDSVSKDEEKFLERLDAYDMTEDSGDAITGLPFCIPCDFVDQVQAKPPVYKHIHTPRYDLNHKPPRDEPTGNICDCRAKGRTKCGDDCLNRLLMVECVGGSSINGKGGTKSPYHNCQLGPDCGNRAISQRKAAKCKPKREQGKGWGLITVEGIKKGGLVQEYVGEVIDQKETDKRLLEWSEKHPNDPNFYVMALDKGWYLDARVEANLSRFINHSCEPNCILKRMSVNGFLRIGIFALKDIAPGEFLCYDYQFDTKNGDKFLCRCGAVTCRGTMKGGKESEKHSDNKKTKAELYAEAKANYDRDVKFLLETSAKEEELFSQVDVLVPGAENVEETVAAGPQTKYRNTYFRPFLWRNAIQGSNFFARMNRRSKRKPPMMQTRAPATALDVLALIN